ncbi:hypothetical protein CVT25_009053 [Psilocybe cyanescens]|uniref:Uncharacterized protein n=1 Tax=Psilocybe cyanescens TaxID=93625 RepID=A0A409XDP7_PSICY|nr:hypothetical protein CVT25_009053 [Psilocybe cyanescens]
MLANNIAVKQPALGPHRQVAAAAYPETLDDVLITCRSCSMAINVADELSDLMLLLILSQKWTWGAKLTLIDLKALAEYLMARKLPHSDYVNPLSDGTIRADSADSVGILSVPNIITLLPTVFTTTWRTTDTLVNVHQCSHLAPAFIDNLFSGPITHHTAVSIDSQSAPTLSFVSTAAEAAAAWNLLSDEDEDNVVVPANALPTNKDSSVELSSASPQHTFHTGAADLAVAWAISSDEDLASNMASADSVSSIEADDHVLPHENQSILAVVDTTDAAAVWSKSSDSSANDGSGPAAKPQNSSILPIPITPPVGLAELTCLSPAYFSMNAALVHMAVDFYYSILYYHSSFLYPYLFDFVDDTWLPAVEDIRDSNNGQQAADADDAEEFIL